VFVHALPGAASFAACLRLFQSYPLAVNSLHPVDTSAGPAGHPVRGQHERDHAAASHRAGWRRSIVLWHRGAGGTGCYVLTQDPGDDFALWTWQSPGTRCQPVQGYPVQVPVQGQPIQCQRIRPGLPVPATAHQVITEGMPIPRHGALLGWVSDRQATALMPVFHGRPGEPGGPQLRVLALSGSHPLHWPPFSASPLDDGLLWEYVDRGQIVDLTPVIGSSASGAYWVPSQNPVRAERGHGCVVVRRPMATDEYWVPAGVYMDHWMLREQVPAPPASHLVSLPGTVHLGHRQLNQLTS
jgi:hypothetical protein